MRRTIGDILASWPYDPDALCVRLIEDAAGRPALQVRLELGVLQLALDGRPDGLRPHDHESLLDYHEDRAAALRRRCGTDQGYRLTPPECAELRGESAQYYRRYFSLFHLGRFGEVVRDTARNLRALDFLHRHAAADADRWELEQFRPYITMMNALARAELYLAAGDTETAVRVIEVALAVIREFAASHDHRFPAERELEVLGERKRELQRARPSSEIGRLQHQLERAVEAEDYEQAASLRDRIDRATEALPRFWE